MLTISAKLPMSPHASAMMVRFDASSKEINSVKTQAVAANAAITRMTLANLRLNSSNRYANRGINIWTRGTTKAERTPKPVP